MLVHKGLWISISLDGIPGAIIEDYRGNAVLIVQAPERVLGVLGNRYTPLLKSGIPTPDDNSVFALLYRKLETLVEKGYLIGPLAEEDHPAVYNRFLYTRESSRQEVLTLAANADVVVKVREIPHTGDEDEIKQAKHDFGPWIKVDTVFAPNPYVVQAEESARAQKKLEDAVSTYNRRWHAVTRFLSPLLMAAFAALLWWAYRIHWGVGLSVETVSVSIWFWLLWYNS